MIYLFCGDDAKNKIINYEKFIKSSPCQVGTSTTETFFVNRNSFDPIQVESFYSGTSLFSSLCIIIFQGILEHEETRDFVLEKLSLIGKSKNTFIFLEGKLNKSVLDTFKKARAKINLFELPKEKKEKYDNFLVANAFIGRDKLNTWLHFRKMVDLGVSLEEITGVIFWKLKDALLKKNFYKFSEEELKNFILIIPRLLPEARKQGKDAEATLEQFLLEAF
jgi:hypothetical protein